jgi:hypothetical protein
MREASHGYLATRVPVTSFFSVPARHHVPRSWLPLFDGKSRPAGAPARQLVARRTAIVANGPRSHLFTSGTARRDVQELELKRRDDRPGELRRSSTPYQETDWPAKGFEVQVNNSYAGDQQYQERKKTGSLYGIRNVYGSIVPDNQWFRMRIAVRANQVRVMVNDVLTVEYTEPAEPMPRQLSDGVFALQAHDPNSTVLFRNIRARRLPDDIQRAAAPVADKTYRELLRLGGENFPVVDYHTHIKGTLTPDDVLRRWREQGIYAGLAVNGGLSFPVSSDEALEPFLRDRSGRPMFVAFQAEGREWVRLFTRKALERFDYVFTDSMTWTDDAGKRMRLWIDKEVGTIGDPQKFMDTLVDRTVRILG